MQLSESIDGVSFCLIFWSNEIRHRGVVSKQKLANEKKRSFIGILLVVLNHFDGHKTIMKLREVIAAFKS